MQQFTDSATGFTKVNMQYYSILKGSLCIILVHPQSSNKRYIT